MIVPLARARIPGRTARIVLARRTHSCRTASGYSAPLFPQWLRDSKRGVVHEHIDTAVAISRRCDSSLISM